MPEIVLAMAVVSVAMFVRGFTGFGGALLTVPLLSLIWDVQQAVVVVALLQVVTGGILTFRSRRWVARPELAAVVVWSFLGLAAGALLLSSLPLEWLAKGLAVFSIGAGVNLLVRSRIASPPASRSRLGAALAGGGAGLLQGMIGTGGPVIVPYLQRVLPSPFALRSTLLAYFFSLDAVRLAGYVPLGIAGRDALLAGVYLLPVAVICSLAGGRLHVQVSESAFRVAVAALLIVSGLMLLV